MFPANGWRERDAESKKKMSEMGAEENALKSKLLKKKLKLGLDLVCNDEESS